MSSRSNGSCCHGHTHEDHDIDPCMAQEIAQAEKERILYEKLKSQSDRLLMNLNIRTNKLRTRGAVAQTEEDDSYSSCEEATLHESQLCTRHVVQVHATQFPLLHSEHKDSKIFLFCVPCDIRTDYEKEKVEELQKALCDESAASPVTSNSMFARLATKLCVCGRCPEPDSRPTGTLKSVAMVLRGVPSVVLTRNGGLVGVWSCPAEQATTSLHSFISKHL
jgi:hypothetical protein